MLKRNKRESQGIEKKQKKLKEIRSTQIYSPVLDIKDGIIATKDGRFVKLMEFSPINFSLRSNEEKDVIISEFAAALRTMPDMVQFKVMSQKSDKTEYIDQIIEHAKEETEPGCLKLMEDQARLITSLSENQGISRRFFVAFPYEGPSGINRPSFRQIRDELNQQGRTIANALHVCGNDLLSTDRSEYILTTLYSIFSRNEKQHHSFEERESEVLARYAANPNISFTEDVHIPINDFIAPNAIDATSPKYIVVDGLYYMFCVLPKEAYPMRAVGGWMSMLVNMGEGIDVDIYIHRENVKKIQGKLWYKMRDNLSKTKYGDDTDMNFDSVSAALQSSYHIREGISNGEEIYYFSTMITITAKSKEELMARYSDIEKYCVSRGLKLKPLLFEQEAAFLSSLPLAKYAPGVWSRGRRNILNSSLASCYPFVSYEVSDENGILVGTNSYNGSLVFINNFDSKKYFNGNMTILGSSGSGKTYTIQTMALRMRQQGTQVFIIAPLKGFEFRTPCEAVGGSFITIAPGSPNNINIMEIRKRESGNDGYAGSANNSRLIEKIQQIHTFFSIAMRDIRPEEKRLLDDALLRTYSRFGITTKNKSLQDPKNPESYRQMPTLADLYKTMESMGREADRLKNVLAMFVTGSAQSFSRPTNVDLNNQYVVVDVSTMTNEMMPIGMFIAIDYIWDKIRENKYKRKVIITDEIWRMIGVGSTTNAAEFILEIFKAIRGFGGAAIAASQDLVDFFGFNNGVYGKGILNNSKIKLLLRTEPKDMEEIKKVMDLTAIEVEHLKSAPRGNCLLVANSNHIFINVETSNSEHKIINTDPMQQSHR